MINSKWYFHKAIPDNNEKYPNNDIPGKDRVGLENALYKNSEEESQTKT